MKTVGTRVKRRYHQFRGNRHEAASKRYTKGAEDFAKAKREGGSEHFTKAEWGRMEADFRKKAKAKMSKAKVHRGKQGALTKALSK